MTEVNGVPILEEAARGCGFRKEGGLYLMAGEAMAPCCLGQVPILPCENCEALGVSCGLKQSRGWTWVRPRPFLRDALARGACGQPCGNCGPAVDGCGVCEGLRHHAPCVVDESRSGFSCALRAMCYDWEDEDRAGLMWVGEKFYPKPEDFLEEVRAQGFSKRVSAVPKDFVVGVTWLLVAHPVAFRVPCPGAPHGAGCECGGELWLSRPGLVTVVKPTSLQQVVSREEAQDDAFLEGLRRRGIDPVIVEPVDPQEGAIVLLRSEEEEVSDDA